jgi:hypothetical protein
VKPLTVKDDIQRAYEEAQKALKNYNQSVRGLKNYYPKILEGLKKKYPNSKIQKNWNKTELLEFNSHKDKTAFFISNFFGDEVFASLSLLLSLEVSKIFDYKIFAIPFANKENIGKISSPLRQAVLNFLIENKINLFVIYSQAHPYLDGFYLETPATINVYDKSQQIIDEVVKKNHEIGAFSNKYDKPTYSIITAGTNELISIAREKGIESYRFMISSDIWAGYRAMLVLLNAK